MKSKRREFLKIAGLTGAGITGGVLGSFTTGTGVQNFDNLPKHSRKLETSHVQRFNMSGYAAPKIDAVRIGIIGLGNRGPTHMLPMSLIEGVEIKALCDLIPERVERAREKLKGTDHHPDLFSGGEYEWKKLCDRKDINLVMITTPWYMHAEMAIYAMEQGKHVACEVPAAATIEDCWQLVETAERTRKHCMMMENYAFLPFQLLTLNMARRGFFGEIVHADCAYSTSKMDNNFRKNGYWDMWWLKQYATRKGNIYPTHGLGPVCQIMDINRGDKLDFLVSIESKDFMMGARAKGLAATDDFYKPFVGKDYRGNMNTTLIKTSKGRTIMLQHDATSPSPHNLIHGIYGTKGAALYDPQPPRLSVGQHEWVSPGVYQSLQEKYRPKILTYTGKGSDWKGMDGHGGADMLMDWHLIDCLRNGLPLDQDVYDAVTWSCILPLSEWSVNNHSNSIEIPDFTSGAWNSNKRNMDINLERGGITKLKI